MHWKLFSTNVVRGIISFRSWNCSQGISSWWHCLNLKLNFFIFLCFPILTELSQNCQGCFPGREKTMETKKKRKEKKSGQRLLLGCSDLQGVSSPISSLISPGISVLHFPMIQPHWQVFSFQKIHGLSHPNSSSFFFAFRSSQNASTSLFISFN